MYAELTTRMIRTIRDAAKRLTGAQRRRFEAQVAIDYCQGSPRKAETIFALGTNHGPNGIGRIADRDQNGLTIELVYYPPYHSKYNSVERCWGILEQHWNGAILDSFRTVLAWTRSMTWKGVSPLVRFFDKTYEKGVRLSNKAFRSYSDRRKRSKSLPKWSVTIGPLVAEPS